MPSSFTTPATIEEDPQECPGCLAAGDICQWHAGWQAGWDQAAAVVGALVLDAGGDR